MSIYNEADYLQAHLTTIHGKSRAKYPTLRVLLGRVAFGIKKWFRGNARLHSGRFLKR